MGTSNFFLVGQKLLVTWGAEKFAIKVSSVEGLGNQSVKSVLILVSVKMESNCRTPRWCQRIAECEKKPTLLVSSGEVV